MANLGIDGLVSGLDTTSLIKQLMQVEAAPQTLLKAKQTNVQSLVAGLQSLNVKIASLAESAKTASLPASWSTFKATSSSTTATATAGATAQGGSVSFSVDALAASQVSVTAAVPDDGTLAPGTTPSLTVKKQDGTLVTVTAASSSLADLAKAVNDSAATGVKATVVQVSGGATPTYRLQLTGSSTGATNAFQVFAGTDDTGPRLDANVVRGASDASITLWKGTGVEQTFTQASNTFTGLMTGVDVTVSKVTGPTDDPVTISVARDTAAAAKLASGLVGTLGVVLAEITSRTATTTKTNTDGTTTVTGGLFSGDGTVRSAQERLLSAASQPVNGDSPASVGITIKRDGTFSFDETKFQAALAADPARVQAVVSGIAARVEDVATEISDKYTGTLTLKITGQQSLVKDMGVQIEGWDRRLELRQQGLQATYSALEVTLSRLNSQSNWLASQLNGLSASS